MTFLLTTLIFFTEAPLKATSLDNVPSGKMTLAKFSGFSSSVTANNLNSLVFKLLG